MFMQKLYQLEAYHWDKDYWSIIGTFTTIELALQGKEFVESRNKMVSCSIFEKEVNNSLEDLVLV